MVDDPRHRDHVGHSERDLRERDQLTPQERQIAMLAAAGLNNKQIGQRLFLSHRTVGAHLYQVFPKLGITSRAALRDALAPSRRSATARTAGSPSLTSRPGVCSCAPGYGQVTGGKRGDRRTI